MRTIWLELRSDCARCLSPIPVNMLAKVLPCPRCGTEIDVSPEVVFAQVVEGREGQVGMFGAAGPVQGRFGPADDGPLCSRCSAPLDMTRAMAEGAAPCTRCSERASFRPVPEPLAGRFPPGATHLVGESFAPPRAKDGETPLVQRFYLWADPDAQARADAERRRVRARYAPWWFGVGLALVTGAAATFLTRGAGLYAALSPPGTEGSSGATLALFISLLAAALFGATFIAHAVSRYSRGLSIALSLAGFLLAAGCGLFLYLKGYAPWAAVGEAIGGGWALYLVIDLLPSGATS